MKTKTVLATWQVIFWLLVIPIVGLWLMWNGSKNWECAWNENVKFVVTVAMIGLWVIGMM